MQRGHMELPSSLSLGIFREAAEQPTPEIVL